MQELVEVPEFFKAILATEVARVSANLEAGRTLKGGWFFTVGILTESYSSVS